MVLLLRQRWCGNVNFEKSVFKRRVFSAPEKASVVVCMFFLSKLPEVFFWYLNLVIIHSKYFPDSDWLTAHA